MKLSFYIDEGHGNSFKSKEENEKETERVFKEMKEEERVLCGDEKEKGSLLD